MNVLNQELVLVRGINNEWVNENFTEMAIYFGGPANAIPKNDAYYIGIYSVSPISLITHICVVESIERKKDVAIFNLKSIIKLQKPIDPKHGISKHENWKLSDFGLSSTNMNALRNQLGLI